MHNEYIALIGLAGSLLATLIVSTWKFSSLASKLLATVQQLERKDAELEARTKAIDTLPAMDVRLGHLEQNHSLIPALSSRVTTLEEQVKHSKEMRQVLLRQSRPDNED